MTNQTHEMPFTAEHIQKIREQYNAGGELSFIIQDVFEKTGLVVSKRTIHTIGQRQICRYIPEPDGSPCKPEGVYGLLLEQYELRERERMQYQEEVLEAILTFLKANPQQHINAIAEAIDRSSASARNAISQLEAHGKVKCEQKRMANRAGGRPVNVWSIGQNETDYPLPKKTT